MRREAIALAGAMVFLSAAAAQATEGDESGESAHRDWPDTVETVMLRNVDGDRVGTVRMRQKDESVWVSASLHSLSPGFHGFHVHETGVCDPAAADGPFTSAGGHYTGGDAEHGEHAGDLPSLLVTDSGKARLSFVTDRFSLDELRDGDGSAVMVHEGRDNFANIPDRYSVDGESGPDQATVDTGDAGTRAACGAIDAG